MISEPSAQFEATEQPIGRLDRTRARAAWEIVFVVGCVLIAEWAVIPMFGRNKTIGMIPVAVVLVFGTLSHRARGERASEIGFGRNNLMPAVRMLVPWMILASAALVTTGSMLGSLHFARPRSWGGFALSEVWLLLWGLMQQYALQAIVNRRLQEIYGRGAASILGVALVFSLLHLPNVWLMAATFAGGILWAAVYQKAPNLYVLALSHSIMTSVLAGSLSPVMLHGLRVGYNYF